MWRRQRNEKTLYSTDHQAGVARMSFLFLGFSDESVLIFGVEWQRIAHGIEQCRPLRLTVHLYA